MKKILLATILACSAIAASATDVTVRGNTGSIENRNGYGLSVGTQLGKLGVEAGFDRFNGRAFDHDRYSLVGSLDVAKLGKANLSTKAGVAYIDNKVGSDGYAALVGAGLSYPVTKSTSAVVDYTYQFGQTRIQKNNGNVVSVGLKYTF